MTSSTVKSAPSLSHPEGGASKKKTPKHKSGAVMLRALREQMGWSRNELGAKAGVSGKWIGFIEDTSHEPTERIKGKLARPFGMLPWDIWKSASSPLTPADLKRLRDLIASEDAHAHGAMAA